MTTQPVAKMTLAVPFEEQFKCCICLDIYTNPTSIPCGHNFCLDCIEDFWDTKKHYECPLCKETFRRRPKLNINRGFAEIIDIYKRSLGEDADTVSLPESRKSSLIPLGECEQVPCDICFGDKSPAFKSCLCCLTSYCENHLTPHLSDPTLQGHRLTDPDSFITNHLCRKHKKPLTMFCKKDRKPVCVTCTEKEHKRHDTVPIETERKRVKTCLKETKSSIKQMIHARQRKMEEIKTSVDLSKQNTEKEIQGSAQACRLLINAIERHQARLVEELEEKQQEAERRAGLLLVELHQEIHELKSRGRELQQLEHNQNPVTLLQSVASRTRLPSIREWSEVTVHSDNCMGTVTRAFSNLVDICQELSNKLSADEADKLDQYAVNVTLDPETASGWLVLSPDRKTVTVSSQKNIAPLPDIPQRFNSCVCVLGKQSFKSGRRYWEVQVGDKSDWDLGVAKESINRKGAIAVRPDSGYWAICRRKGGNLNACAGPTVALQLQDTPQKVAVFLDYEEGSVSFYDADSKSHIYTYSGCDFSEPLYPYFNPCVQGDGKNTAPLVICPLEGRVEEQGITIESYL